MFKNNLIIILLFYLINVILEQNISNTYDVINHEKKKTIIKDFIVNYNSSFIETKEIIIETKNNEEYFMLNNQTYIIFPSNNQELSNYADALTLYIKNYTGLEILVAPNVIRKTSNKNKNTFIQIVLDKTLKNAFQIEISKRKIKLLSNSNLGIKRAIIIFKTIFDNNFKSNNTIYENIEFPSAEIFAYEKNTNIGIIIIIIFTLLILYISFRLIKSKI